MRKGFRARFSPDFVLALALCAAAPAAAAAADVSAWDEDVRSAVRLIGASAARDAGSRDAGSAVLRAGVEIRLRPGWKTYWRYPGDSGVPPAFDFAASENVGSVTVLWPAPVRFADGSGKSIGYKAGVIFPLRVVPQDARKPVVLRLALDYAVCENLCVPARGKAELKLTGEAGAQETALKAAEALVPKPGAVGADAAFAIRRAWRDPAAPGKPRVLVEVAAPPGAEVDLFAEGPTSDWALPLPEPVEGAAAGVRRFAFELDGLPKDARTQGAAVTLTATAGKDAVEAVFRLD